MSAIKSTIAKLESNSKEVFDEAARLIIKIADNILKEPTNLKIRKLQKSNATVSKKILCVNGGLECLKLLGFEEDNTHLILPPSACLNSLEVIRDEISRRHKKLLEKNNEPNMFLGLIENMSVSENPVLASNQIESDDHDTSADSSDDISTSSREESEDEVVNKSGGAIPKVRKQPVRQIKQNQNGDKSHLMPDIPFDVPRVQYPVMTQMFSNRFLSELNLFSHRAIAYGDKALKQRAKSIIPVERIEVSAQKRLRLLQEQLKKDKIADMDVTIQDMLILELLSWFKNEFFTWVDTLDCKYCRGKTTYSHMSLDSGLSPHTKRVEMHKCNQCQQFTPFPRYDDVNILLITRRGRCGEWANTFTLLCCAMDWDARYVVDEGDHVWTEVYSFGQKRWLHCDPCEDACDTPLMYENGWGKKLTYVIAYSNEDIQDVTWRYSSHHKEVLARRNHCKESELVHALLELRKNRQQNLSEARKQYLTRRTAVELAEMLFEKKPTDSDKQGRSSGDLVWRLARGEIQDEVESSHTWVVSKDDARLGGVTIRYSPSTNRYESMCNGDVKAVIDGWQKGAFMFENIFRKEEKDWKMVYLARKESASHGCIKWKFESADPNLVFDDVYIKFDHKAFENGKVEVLLQNENITIVLNESEVNTKAFSGSKSIFLIANLSGGKGDVAWQHAQLFRQSINDEEYPFYVRLNFKR